MRILRLADRDSEPSDPNTFTGNAQLTRMTDLSADPKIHAYRVEFEPAARTAWHTHSGPQILIVLNGCCRLQRHGKPLTEIIAGDVVCIEPRERHWHGAGPDSPMTHVAINIDSTTTWLGKVTETEYVGAFR